MNFEKVSSKSSKAGKFKRCPDMRQFNICRPDICWLNKHLTGPRHLLTQTFANFSHPCHLLTLQGHLLIKTFADSVKMVIYWFRLISHKISKKVKNMPKGTIWKSNESLKLVSKMTHHFIHGHPSRKQTVTLYLKDSIIAVQDFREKRKYSIKVQKTF